MTLVVETGAGLSDAESYVSVTDASAYFDAHGGPSTQWTAASTGTRESALRYATQWLDTHYTWPGMILNFTQRLAWPRRLARDNEGRLLAAIPWQIIAADCELAREHLISPLNAAISAGNYLQSVNTSRTDGGDTESIAVTYKANSPSKRSFPLVDDLLAMLVGASGSGSYAVRA